MYFCHPKQRNNLKFIKMSKKENLQEPEELQNVENALSSSEEFIENHLKEIIYAVIAIVAVFVGFFLFKYKYLQPRELKHKSKSTKARNISHKTLSHLPSTATALISSVSKTLPKNTSGQKLQNSLKCTPAFHITACTSQKRQLNCSKASTPTTKWFRPLSLALLATAMWL